MKDRRQHVEASKEFQLFLIDLFAPIKIRVKDHKTRSKEYIPDELTIGPNELKTMYVDLSLESINAFLKKHSASVSPEALKLLDALSWVKSYDNNTKQNGVVDCGPEGIKVYENRKIVNVKIKFDANPKEPKLSIVDNSDAMLLFDSQSNQNGSKSLRGGTITTTTGQELIISTSKEPAKNMLGPKHGIEITDNKGKIVAAWKGAVNENDLRGEVLYQETLNGIVSPKNEFIIDFTADGLLSEKIEVRDKSNPLTKRGFVNPTYGKGTGVSDFFGFVRGEKVIGISASTTGHDTAPRVSTCLTITEHHGASKTRKDVLLTKAKTHAFIDTVSQKNINAVIELIAGPLHESINSR